MKHLPIDSSFILALVMVCFYATNRFNTPPAVRSQTSRFQYVSSCVFYVISSVGLFILLTWLLVENPQALDFLHFGASGSLPPEMTKLAAPLIVTLAMTTLLPSFPMLRDFDAKLLRIFHRMGSIPIAAVQWSKRMKEWQFAVSPELRLKVENYISNSSALPDDIPDDIKDEIKDELRTDPSIDSARYRFTRNLALYVLLSQLDSQTRFAEDYPEEAASFEKTMASYFAQSAGFFALTRHIPPQLEPLPEPIRNARDAYKTLCNDVYEEIRLMLARIILYSSNGPHEVRRQLARLGFAIESEQEIRISANVLVLNAIGVVTLFAVATVLATGSGVTTGSALVIGCVVALNQSIAAVFAVVPKQLWAFADIRRSAERPIAAYAISALCTFTICLPIMFGLWLLRPELSLPSIPFSAQCKWLLLPIATAAVLAFECDDYVAENREPTWLRWIEGAALAVIMALAGFVTVRWVYEGLDILIPKLVLLPILLSASMGFLFGTTIPTGYRKILRQTGAPSR